MAALILRYELKGKAKKRPDIFKVGFGSVCKMCQCFLCEASEQRLGLKPKSTPEEIKLFCFTKFKLILSVSF